jgi:hypothetical protein
MAGLAPRAAHAVLAELVEVTNTTAHPVPTHEVSTPTRTPFQMEQTIAVANGFEGQNGFISVPLGKRLVIEYASAQVSGSRENFLFSVITEEGQGNDVRHFLVPIVTPFGGGTVTSGQVVELFSDPGTNVILRVDRDSPAGAVNVFFSVSGYLQDVP